MATVMRNNNHHNRFSMLSSFNFFGPRPTAAPAVQAPQLAKAVKMTVMSDERIDVIVGVNGKARIWRLHKDLVCQFSAYFASLINAGTSEALAGTFTLSDQDPAVFALFVQWLYSTNKDIKVGGPECELESNDPWVRMADKAWNLGGLLQCDKFSRFALVKYMQGIRHANPNTLLSIYHDSKLKHGCALRKFTAAWLWYVRHTHALLWSTSTWWIGGGDLADPACGPLVKRMLKDREFAISDVHNYLEKAVDPHWLRLDHWYNDCSNDPLPHNCPHVPYPCNMNMWGQRWY